MRPPYGGVGPDSLTALARPLDSNTCSIDTGRMAWGFPAYEPPAAKGAGLPRAPGTEGFAPAGWPREVRPPGAPGWEASAAAWLLDLCPADWRGYPGLRKHLVVLARFALCTSRPARPRPPAA